MLRQRRLCVGLGLTGACQLALGLLHLPGLPCPTLHVVGVPCPACGATRACAAVLRGDWHTWLTMHAFAPVFLGGAALLAAGAVLPDRPRDRLVRWIDRVERRTALAKWLIAAVLVYWAARLVYAPGAFARLMLGA